MRSTSLRKKKAREWNSRIQEARNSGLTITRWCRDHNISVRQFYEWEKRLRDNPNLISDAEEDSCFYEMPDKTETGSLELTPQKAMPETVIQYGMFNILVTSQTKEETLMKVLKVIRNA